MPNSDSELYAEKPLVQMLVAGEVDREMLDCIEWGLEEEGIPVARRHVAGDMTVNALAARAARESRLHVGIGVSGRSNEAALYHRDMPAEKPLLTAPVCRSAREELVCLGKNAARLVKGNPFCFENENSVPARNADTKSGYSPEVVEQIASHIVEALSHHFEKGQDR